MINFVAAVVILIIVGAAITYIVKAKKKGVKCIGCPAAGSCSGNHHQNDGAGCGCSQAQNK